MEYWSQDYPELNCVQRPDYRADIIVITCTKNCDKSQTKAFKLSILSFCGLMHCKSIIPRTSIWRNLNKESGNICWDLVKRASMQRWNIWLAIGRVTRTGPDGQGTHLHGHSITHTAHQHTLARVLLSAKSRSGVAVEKNIQSLGISIRAGWNGGPKSSMKNSFLPKKLCKKSFLSVNMLKMLKIKEWSSSCCCHLFM